MRHSQAAVEWLAEQPLVHWVEPQPRLHRHNYLANGVCQSAQAAAVDSSTSYGTSQSATHQLWAAGLQVSTRPLLKTSINPSTTSLSRMDRERLLPAHPVSVHM